MSNDSRDGCHQRSIDELSLAELKQIDTLCQAFEAGWQTSVSFPPSLAEHLANAPAHLSRAGLFCELLRIELAYIRRCGLNPSLSDYQVRFPDLADVARIVFAESSMLVASGAGYSSTRKPFSDGSLASQIISPHDQKRTNALGTFANYQLLELIAQGGMGIVYKALQLGLNRIVALKMTLAGQFASVEERRRFHSEAIAAGKLDHPHIVPIFDVGEHQGQPYFSMGYVDGKSLKQLLSDGPLPPREAAELMRSIAAAVQYAHDQGIIHRDLKPANVLIDRHGQPRITDFGLAKSAAVDSSLTAAGQVLGTPSFMPPEQARGDLAGVGPSADVYAMGATLYCLLTGRPPFQAATIMDTLKQVLEDEPVPPTQLNPQLPRDLETICLKALQKSPQQRYDKAADLAAELQRYLVGRPILARPVSSLERMFKWYRRNRSVAALLLTAFTLSVAVAIVSTVAYFREARHAKDLYDLAQEKDALAISNGQLATDSRNLQAAAEAKNVSLKASLAANYFAHGVAEFDAGHYASGLHELQRACQMTSDSSPLRPHYRQVFLDRSLASGRLCAPLLRHDRWITSAAFSPDGGRVVTGSLDNTARLWDARTAEPLSEPMHHEAAVVAVAFSPSGDRVLTGSEDHTARLWDGITGASVATPMKHDDKVTVVAFSPNGQRVLTGSDDHTARVWDALTGAAVSQPMRHNQTVQSACFSPRGNHVLTSSFNDLIQVWDAETGSPIGPPIRQKDEFGSQQVLQVAYNPRGDRIVTGEIYAPSPRQLVMFDIDIARGQPIVSLPGPDASLKVNSVLCPVFDPTGDRVVAGFGRTMQIWDADSRHPIGTPLTHSGDIFSVSFDLTGNRIITGSHDYSARMWDAATGAPIGDPLMHDAAVTVVAFSPAGDRFLTASGDGTARLWNAVPRELSVRRLPNPHNVMGATLDPSGRFYLTIDYRTAQLWDIPTGVAWGPSIQYDNNSFRGAVFSGDGNWLATKVDDGSIRIWHLQSGVTLSHQLQVGAEVSKHISLLGPYFNFALSPDGDRIATAIGTAEEHTAYVIDAKTGVKLSEPMRHPGEIDSMVFTSDGQRIVSLSFDDTIRVWDGANGRLIGMPVPREEHCQKFWLSASRDWLIAQSMSGTVSVSDVKSLLPIGKPFHSEPIADASVSPDGLYIATAGHDRLAVLWDLWTGLPTGLPMRHDSAIASVSFSQRGDRILTVAYDDTARIWDGLTGVTLGEPYRFAGNAYSTKFTPRGDRVILDDLTATRIVEIPSLPQPENFEQYSQLVTGWVVDAEGAGSKLPHDEWTTRWRDAQANRSQWIEDLRASVERRQMQLQPMNHMVLAKKNAMRRLFNGRAPVSLTVHKIPEPGSDQAVQKFEVRHKTQIPSQNFRVQRIAFTPQAELQDDDFACLADCHVLTAEQLSLEGYPRLTGAVLAHLKQWFVLSELALGGNQRIQGRDFEPVGQLKFLRALFAGSTGFDDQSATCLTRLTQLRLLDVTSTALGDEGMIALCQLKSLQDLCLNHTRITDRSLALVPSLMALHILRLNRTQISDAGLEHLTRLPALATLDVAATSVSDEGLPQLVKLTKLRMLDLRDTKVTDAGLSALAAATSLEHVWLNGTQITPAGVAALQQALPKCQIDVETELQPVPPTVPAQ